MMSLLKNIKYFFVFVIKMSLIPLIGLRKFIERNADLLTAIAVIVALIQWFWTKEERDNQRYYVAWAQINSAPHAPINDSSSVSMQHNAGNSSGPCGDPSRRLGDSGRKIALQDLNKNDKSLAGAPLSYAVLPNTHFDGANLDRIDLRHADLFGSYLKGVDLWGGSLQHATLIFAHLEGSHLQYAQLANACLQGAHLYQYDIKPYLGSIIPVNGNNFHMKAELEQRYHVKSLPRFISHIIGFFYSINIFCQDCGDIYQGSSLQWYVYYKDIEDKAIEVKTDLKYACLKGADLKGADLEHADLSHTHLEYANLSTFPLEDIRSLEMQFIKLKAFEKQGASPSDVLNSYSIAAGVENPGMARPEGINKWPFTNLTNAVLHDAKLKFANLTGAVLHGADLKFANLTGAVLHGADLINADLTGAILFGAKLEGAQVRFENIKKAYLCKTELPTVWQPEDLSHIDKLENGDRDCGNDPFFAVTQFPNDICDSY